MLVEVFEFVAEQPTHVLAPQGYPFTHAAFHQHCFGEGRLQHAHEHVHDRGARDFLWTVEEPAAYLEQEAASVADKGGKVAGGEVAVVGFEEAAQHVQVFVLVLFLLPWAFFGV